MKLVVKPTSTLEGVVEAPPSKSYTHRAIILSSLADGVSVIKNPLLSEDTLATIEACGKIGAEIKILDEGSSLYVKGVSGRPSTPEDEIDARNSGTTLRIMTSVCSLCNSKVVLTGDSSIQKRPMQPLLNALKQLGVETSSRDGMPPVSVKGPLKGGFCSIRGDVSSQFISGLLIATPLAEEDTTIKVTTEFKSKPYVDVTLDLMKKFKANIEKAEEKMFKIKGSQKYAPTKLEIEGDYSSAAIILAAAALTNSKVTVKNLLRNSKQGDRRFIEILKDMDVKVQEKNSEVTVEGRGEIKAVEADLGDTPDLMPITAALGSVAEGKTLIKNVGHLRFKESDRLKAMASELRKMGARVHEGPDFIELKGVKYLKGGSLSGWRDHRIVMSLAVAALKAKDVTVIDDAETIPVSFPDFVDKMRKLKADMKTEGG